MMYLVESIDEPNYEEFNSSLEDLGMPRITAEDSSQAFYDVELAINRGFRSNRAKNGFAALRYLHAFITLRRIIHDKFGSDPQVDDFIIASKLVVIINEHEDNDEAKHLLDRMVSLWFSALDFDKIKRLSYYFDKVASDTSKDESLESIAQSKDILKFESLMMVLKDLTPSLNLVFKENLASVQKAFESLTEHS